MLASSWTCGVALALVAAAPSGASFRGVYVDHNDKPIAEDNVTRACDEAIGERLARGPAPHELRVDEDVAHDPASKDENGISICYLLMAGRNFAHFTVSRLVRSLYSKHNLYLIHIDAKLGEEVVRPLRETFEAFGNIHVLRRRRSVGWGAFSMVSVLLDAIATAVHSGGAFDFFINLSDSDITLRTHAELSAFLLRFRNRSFVAVKDPGRDEMRYKVHAHMRRHPFVECAGLGFAVLNHTAASLFGDSRQCCLARSGPIMYTRAPLHAPAVAPGVEVFHGSQWVVLARPLYEYLVRRPLLARGPSGAAEAAAAADASGSADGAEAAAAESGAGAAGAGAGDLIDALESSYMADEVFVQTAAMNSPYRDSIISHNLRYIDWPQGASALEYWQSMGHPYASGPRVLRADMLSTLRASEAIFARKVDPMVDSALIDQWQDAIERKMRGAHLPEQPLIAQSFVAEDAGLTQLAPPPLREERERDPEAARRRTDHPVHYGNEDIVATMYQPGASVERASGARGHLAYVTFEDGSVCHCDRACTATVASCCAERIPGCTRALGEDERRRVLLRRLGPLPELVLEMLREQSGTTEASAP